MANRENNNYNFDLAAAIEAILFVYGEPLSEERLLKILKGHDFFKKVTKENFRESLEELEKKLSEGKSGVKLIHSGGEVQLATKPEFAPLLENFVKEEFKENLSPASLEALSLIAYLGPLSRSQIEYYRGVNSSFILRSLLMRGIIDRFPNPERGNIYLYRPSFDLLRYLGLSKIEELPDYSKYKEGFNSLISEKKN